jgi:mono/diheme cytochrome c family protein
MTLIRGVLRLPLLITGLLCGLLGTPAQAAPAGQAVVEPQRAFLDQYCVTCHNPRMKAGALVLDGLDPLKAGELAVIWEKVVRKLRTGMMPPPGRPRPDEAAANGFVAALEARLDHAASVRPDPGRTETFHRLNRFEYQNAVRDILHVDIDVASLLPPDDAGYGFDNMAGVLRLSQSLMERYLTAARRIAREAVGSVPPTPVANTFPVSSDLPQYEHVEGLPFGTRGGLLVPYNFPRDGEYLLRAQFSCALVSAGGCDPTADFDDEHQLEVSIDGERVHVFTMPPTPRGGAGGFGKVATGKSVEDTRWQLRLAIKAGQHDVGVAFLKLPSYETTDYPRLRFIKPSYEGNMVPEGLGIYQPHLKSVTIAGPFGSLGGPGDTPARERILLCQPTSKSDEAPCARTIVESLLRQAYRRPVTAVDVDKLMAFYSEERTAGNDFEAGIEMVVRALLVQSEFLFRIELDPVAANAGTYRLSDLDLASRLSFFLWSSVPDEELIRVAASGLLKEPAMFERQVRRMLADPRSVALARSFLPQWLQLRSLAVVSPDDSDFDEGLREGMRMETELFFDSIVRDDRPIIDLLTADYTFLNERLAWHYGVTNVKGSHFRRVTLPVDSPRRGLLGQGSVLTTTSHAIRTSPVKRGKWIMESVLGVSPPPPPANVPPLDESKGGAAAPQSMRERMAAHRANPVCAGCHAVIDPLGFALENFDQTGRYRTVDQSTRAVDVSGTFPDGTGFKALGDFKARITSRPERFAAALTEKLLTYGLGRGLGPSDMPTVRAIVRQASSSNYRLSAVVLGIATSTPFQMRRTLDESVTAVAAK